MEHFVRSIIVSLLLLFGAVTVAISFTGCTATAPAATLNQRIAETLATVTAVRQTALALLESGKISADDAENVQRQADAVRAGVELARAMSAASPIAADAKLSQTRTALVALQTYLTAREARK